MTVYWQTENGREKAQAQANTSSGKITQLKIRFQRTARQEKEIYLNEQCSAKILRSAIK